jgi:hypothetical protein
MSALCSWTWRFFLEEVSEVCREKTLKLRVTVADGGSCLSQS